MEPDRLGVGGGRPIGGPTFTELLAKLLQLVFCQLTVGEEFRCRTVGVIQRVIVGERLGIGHVETDAGEGG